MAIAEWEFGFVLPNLVLPADADDHNPGAFPGGISFDSRYLRIFPGTHAEVQALRSQSPVVEQILASFRNEHGKPYSPSALLVRASAPDAIKRNLEAFVAFRNAVAMPIVLRGRAGVVLDRGSSGPTWSDTFDFHPVRIGGRERMILQSPALFSVVADTATLQLTHSPYVALEGRRLWPDHYLLWSLGRAWCRRFTPAPTTDAFGQRLFRSLEVAYQACAVGAKCEASLHDYGTQIALWVSACEILAWPERKHADLPAVLSLLDRYPGRAATLKRRFRTKHRGQVLRLSAPQRAYAYLYSARNDFLHGNPVNINTMMTRNRASERIGLPRVAALVYRIALASYLNTRYSIDVPFRDLRGRAIEMFDHHSFEEGFAEAFGYKL